MLRPRIGTPDSQELHVAAVEVLSEELEVSTLIRHCCPHRLHSGLPRLLWSPSAKAAGEATAKDAQRRVFFLVILIDHLD